MRIPSQIKVGAHVLKVKLLDKVENDDNGRWNSRIQEIHLKKDLPPTELEVTFMHEIIHAINYELKHTDVEFLAQALYQVIKDNGLVFDGREVKK